MHILVRRGDPILKKLKHIKGVELYKKIGGFLPSLLIHHDPLRID